MKRTEETIAPSAEVSRAPSAEVSVAPLPAAQAGPQAPPAQVVDDPTAHLHEVLVYATAGLVGFLGPRRNDPQTRFDAYQALRRSPEVDHLCSREVDHLGAMR